MSTPRWTDDQLLAAFNAAADLVGWTGNVEDRVKMGAVRFCADATISREWVTMLSSASPDNPMRLGHAEAFHFARRVREHLGVDTPAWQRVEWEEYSLWIKADIGCHRLFVDIEPIKWAAVANTLGVYIEHGRGRADSLDAAKAAAHDALVRYLLRSLRAAMGDAGGKT